MPLIRGVCTFACAYFAVDAEVGNGGGEAPAAATQGARSATGPHHDQQVSTQASSVGQSAPPVLPLTTSSARWVFLRAARERCEGMLDGPQQLLRGFWRRYRSCRAQLVALDHWATSGAACDPRDATGFCVGQREGPRHGPDPVPTGLGSGGGTGGWGSGTSGTSDSVGSASGQQLGGSGSGGGSPGWVAQALGPSHDIRLKRVLLDSLATKLLYKVGTMCSTPWHMRVCPLQRLQLFVLRAAEAHTRLSHAPPL